MKFKKSWSLTLISSWQFNRTGFATDQLIKIYVSKRTNDD